MPGTASRFIPLKTSSSVPHDDWYPPPGASADRTALDPHRDRVVRPGEHCTVRPLVEARWLRKSRYRSGNLWRVIAKLTCKSAWNKDPVSGVIGIQSGPPGRRVHNGFHGEHGGQVGDADCGDDCQGLPGLLHSPEADHGDLPGVWAVASGRAQGDSVGSDRVSV